MITNRCSWQIFEICEELSSVLSSIRFTEPFCIAAWTTGYTSIPSWSNACHLVVRYISAPWPRVHRGSLQVGRARCVHPAHWCMPHAVWCALLCPLHMYVGCSEWGYIFSLPGGQRPPSHPATQLHHVSKLRQVNYLMTGEEIKCTHSKCNDDVSTNSGCHVIVCWVVRVSTSF